MNINNAVKAGFSFGLTSGIITTMGLMVGLHSGTHSKVAVIGGILTIAVADSFSDALGMHVSQESHNGNSNKDIWTSTVATFIAKLIFALTFVIPLLITDVDSAVWINIIWGFLVIGVFSYLVAKQRKSNPWEAIREHLTIGVIVIIITHYVGDLIGKVFG